VLKNCLGDNSKVVIIAHINLSGSIKALLRLYSCSQVVIIAHINLSALHAYAVQEYLL